MSKAVCREKLDFEFAQSLADEAREYALAHGIIRYSSSGGITHLPFSLVPWVTDKRFVDEVTELTLISNHLYHRVSREVEFLREHLSGPAQVDDFIRNLLDCLPDSIIEKPAVYLNRNDCMPVLESGVLIPRQVEMNLIASALGMSSSRVYNLHKFLYRDTVWEERLVPNPAGELLQEGLRKGHSLFGDPKAAVLFLIPPGEVNVFEQRTMEAHLYATWGIPVMRATLDQLGEEGCIRGGDLWYRNRKIAVAYFRAGYTPGHYRSPVCWQARKLLESSTAISIPSVATQLANTKKMQQVLSSKEILKQFVSEYEAERLTGSFVLLVDLEEVIAWKGKVAPAEEVAMAYPEDWVLKPLREGGGNNFFGEAMVKRLSELEPGQKKAYVLMEKIRQQPFRSVRLVDNEVLDGDCITELGVYGVYTVPEGKVEADRSDNIAGGYLLRTKDVCNNEGLVLGGYSFLDVVAACP